MVVVCSAVFRRAQVNMNWSGFASHLSAVGYFRRHRPSARTQEFILDTERGRLTLNTQARSVAAAWTSRCRTVSGGAALPGLPAKNAVAFIARRSIAVPPASTGLPT